MSQRWVGLVVLALLLLPGALGHGGQEDEFRYNAGTNAPNNEPARVVEVPAGYTGPGREAYLSYFEGVWLYGRMSATPLGLQRPTDMDADGDWVVWEDAARSDIYAFSVSAGQGFYLQSDKIRQHHPRVSGNVVVYEDYRNVAKPAIFAYFLDTGETRRLSNATTSVREPELDWPIVAWLDDNLTNPDVWAYSLLNNTAWNLHASTDRDNHPIVVRERVFWRTYRYNIWDVIGYDTRTQEELQVTTDAEIQSAPFTNGDDLLFLTNYYDIGWTIERFDVALEELRHTDIRIPDSSQTSASGDALLRVAQDVDYAQLVVRNLTSGATNHVSGNLLLATAPVIEGHTILAILRTREGTSLLALQVSPFAFAKKPTLTIASPANNAPWLRPLVVQGILSAGPEFTEPSTFTYRLDNQPPQIVPVAQRWRFTLDPNGVEPGQHIVTVRATFREGPPVYQSIVLAIPAPSQTVDIERAGPAFHAARLLGELNAYVLDNPASWFLIPLVLLILALLSFRFWLWLKPRRRQSVVEYVTPDDA